MVYRALRAAAIGVLLSPGVFVQSSSGATGREVLDRHLAYVGRPDAYVVRYRDESTATPAPGGSASSSAETVTYRRGTLFHDVGRENGVGSESGFDGHAFWHANENGYTVLELEDAARFDITRNAVDTGVFAADADVRQRPARTVDGAAEDVVRVTPKGGVPVDLTIDPATGAYLEIVYDPESSGRAAGVRIDGYTEIAPGIRVPRIYRFGKTSSSVLAHGEVRAVTDAELHAPQPTATWSFSPDAIDIEVERPGSGNRRVVLNASVNGHPGRFLLDSGASSILLYRPYADRLGLSTLGETAFRGVSGGVRSAQLARAKTIAVGGNVLSNVVLEAAGRDPYDKDQLDGIMGFDLLAGALVYVDLEHRQIAFADPAKLDPAVPKGAYAFPVNLADQTPEVLVRAGSVPTRATFDTGDSFFVILSENLHTSGRLNALIDQISIAGRQYDNTVYFRGVDGVPDQPATCYRLNEVAVGPYRYQNAQTCFGNERVFGRDGGLIGFDFLRHFNWTFDYAHNHVVLTPNGL